MRRALRWIVLVGAAWIAGTLVTGARSRKEAVASPAVLDLSFRDFGGAPVDLGRERGRVVVLNFWATWCPACRAELPDLSRFATEERGHCVDVVGVTAESPAVVAGFITRFPLSYPIVQSLPGLEQELGVDVLPTTFILDADGRITRRIEGATSAEHLRAIVAPLQRAPGRC